MTDRLTPEKRSWNMSKIKNRDTKVEVKVRKYLYHSGFRYQKNVATLPGKPDIVLKKYNTIIFVHGCFWHRHENCRDATTPKTRTEFWQKKFDINVLNDNKHKKELEAAGWQVLIIWECEINQKFSEIMAQVMDQILANKTNHRRNELL